MIDKKRLIILDSLRGMAASLVLFHHFFKINNHVFKVYFERNWYFIFEMISDLNKEAVLFFFVLSGFSIGLSLKNNKLDSFKVINEYIYRRLKRILPIYWISILITLIAGVLMGTVHLKDFGFYNFVGNVLFLQTSAIGTPAWFTPYGLNGPLWSLSFEFFFYMIFPLICVLNAKFGTKVNLLYKFLCVFVVAIFSIILNKLFFVPYLLFYSHFPVWLLGYFSAQTYLYKKKYNILFLIVAFLGATYLIVGKNYLSSDSLKLISKGFLINSFFYLVTVFSQSLSSENIILKTINYFFYSIGKGSYAIYALHYPFLLVLHHYSLSVIIQILSIAIYVYCCMILEEITIKWKWNFLRINYCFFYLNLFS